MHEGLRSKISQRVHQLPFFAPVSLSGQRFPRESHSARRAFSSLSSVPSSDCQVSDLVLQQLPAWQPESDTSQTMLQGFPYPCPGRSHPHHCSSLPRGGALYCPETVYAASRFPSTDGFFPCLCRFCC